MSRRPAHWVLEDALSSATRALEALADGETVLAEQIVGGLAHDLEDALRPPQRLRCQHCGLAFRWPGELDHHERFVHGETRKRSRAA
jgi:hypothetical protein